MLDLLAVDPDLVVGPDPVGDVGRRHRAEERARRPRLDVEAELGLAEHVGDLVRLLDRACLVAGALVLDPLQLRDAARRGRLGELAREEEVAGVAAGDVHDLTAEPDLVDVLQEDDLHR